MMKKTEPLTKKSFDNLLAWLHPDREIAGEKYEEIRRELIKLLLRWGSNTPEEFADKTINRVAQELGRNTVRHMSVPDLYFYTMARKVYPLPHPCPPIPKEFDEQKYNCLERCLEELPKGQQSLILEYYKPHNHLNIKLLAQQMGIAPAALRMRVYRINAKLKKCIADRLKNNKMVEPSS